MTALLAVAAALVIIAVVILATAIRVLREYERGVISGWAACSRAPKARG